MKIKPNIELEVPKDLYCGSCHRKGILNDAEYCEIFTSGYLSKTKNGQFIKCEQCLLETRRALIEQED